MIYPRALRPLRPAPQPKRQGEVMVRVTQRAKPDSVTTRPALQVAPTPCKCSFKHTLPNKGVHRLGKGGKGGKGNGKGGRGGKGGKGGKGNNPNRGSNCFNCGDPGHWTRECPNPRREPGSCFRCGDTSHKIDACPFQVDGGQGKGDTQNTVWWAKKVREKIESGSEEDSEESLDSGFDDSMRKGLRLFADKLSAAVAKSETSKSFKVRTQYNVSNDDWGETRHTGGSTASESEPSTQRSDSHLTEAPDGGPHHLRVMGRCLMVRARGRGGEGDLDSGLVEEENREGRGRNSGEGLITPTPIATATADLQHEQTNIATATAELQHEQTNNATATAALQHKQTNTKAVEASAEAIAVKVEPAYTAETTYIASVEASAEADDFDEYDAGYEQQTAAQTSDKQRVSYESYMYSLSAIQYEEIEDSNRIELNKLYHAQAYRLEIESKRISVQQQLAQLSRQLTELSLAHNQTLALTGG